LMKGRMTGKPMKQPRFAAVICLNKQQFTVFKQVLSTFGDDLTKCLRKVDRGGLLGDVDYQCHFTIPVTQPR
jgi:hypothetical protein